MRPDRFAVADRPDDARERALERVPDPDPDPADARLARVPLALLADPLLLLADPLLLLADPLALLADPLALLADPLLLLAARLRAGALAPDAVLAAEPDALRDVPTLRDDPEPVLFAAVDPLEPLAARRALEALGSDPLPFVLLLADVEALSPPFADVS